MSALFTVQNISKSFPGVKVLDDINITFNTGKVHAIVGENGAGKSTLMNVIYGVYQDYSGKLLWEGEEIRFASPTEARDKGIAMVHQENSLIPYLSVMDNIYLGHYPKNGIFVDEKKLKKQVMELMEELKITSISPDARAGNLSVAQKQLIEIIKALSLDAKLLMLDEPTAALTATETEYLLEILNHLRQKGVAIAYISHKLEEVFEIADEISVLRDGSMIKKFSKEEFDYNTVVYHMIGRKLEEYGVKAEDTRSLSNSETVLEVENLGRKNTFHNISFGLRRGEVLGFGGLVGAGRTELMETIFGFEPATEGSIKIRGKEIAIRHPDTAVKNGIGMVPEERKEKGIYPILSVMDNINVSIYKKLKKWGLISKKAEQDSALEAINELSIKTTSAMKLVGQLSGGNQQKCVVARWLKTKPDILILDEPTHGIDIGAKEDIYNIIFELSQKGVAILLISSEMPELIRLSDRIVVMCEGRMTGMLDKEEISQDAIMKYAMKRKEV